MKVFVIIRHHVAGSGHSVTIVKADDEEEALSKYSQYLRMDVVPIGTCIKEIIEDVVEVFHYDNPDYDG